MASKRHVGLAVIALMLLVVGVSGALVAGCRTVPPELRGTWRAAGTLGGGRDDEPGMSWMKEITLQGSSYRMEGYPPLVETARVASVEREGAVYRVALVEHVFHGSPADDVVLVITLAGSGASFELEGSQYYRQAPPPD